MDKRKHKDIAQPTGGRAKHYSSATLSNATDDIFKKQFGVDLLSPKVTSTPQPKRRKPSPSGGIAQQKSPAFLASPPSGKYSTRSKRGVVVSSYRPTGDTPVTPTPANATSSDVADIRVLTKVASPFRYMFDDEDAKIQALDELLRYHMEVTSATYRMNDAGQIMPTAIKDEKSNNDEEKQGLVYSSLVVPNQSSVVVCGRVCCDSPVGKLNPASILLEGDLETSLGRRAPLDVSDLPSYALFAGQVLSMKAINSSGRLLVAQNIVPSIPHPLLPPALDSELRLWVASGPFTTSENMLYAPLADLLRAVQISKPHVLILIGPFLESTHSQVRSGRVQGSTFGSKFLDIVDQIAAAVASIRTRVVLVPSLRDIHTPVVFPQSAFEIDQSTDKIVCVPNPALIDIGGVTLGLMSVDILSALAREEISKSGPAKSRRMCRLAGHVINQRNFYPVFPCAPGDNVDYTRQETLRLSRTPDVLICPSKLNYFAHALEPSECKEPVIVVNPGCLAKGASGGTYSKFAFHPGDSKVPLSARSTVEVVKI